MLGESVSYACAMYALQAPANNKTGRYISQSSWIHFCSGDQARLKLISVEIPFTQSKAYHSWMITKTLYCGLKYFMTHVTKIPAQK